ncbi:MAG: gliding motility-associated C-terminal domain-containing protein [Bacteroidetes bacterium]|nr:gliding motility-associated C-terminal domain-containing protein [Bacteroidota bacterium]
MIVLLQFNQTGAQQYFQKTFGGEETEDVYSIYKLSEGGYVIGGKTESTPNGDANLLVIKLDEDFHQIWSKTYGGPGEENCNQCIPCSQGGFLLTGYTTSFTNGNKDIFILKLDENGNIEWNKKVGGSQDDWAKRILETDDYFIIIGTVESWGDGMRDISITTIDKSGNLIWNKCYGGGNNENGQSVIVTEDNNLLVVATSFTYGPSHTSVLMKIDFSGNLIWFKSYGGSITEYGRNIVSSGNDEYIIVGQTNSFGYGNWDCLIYKVNGNGIPLWSKTIGGSGADVSVNIIENIENNFLVSGNTTSYGFGNKDIFLFEISELGNINWARTFGGNNYDGNLFNQPTHSIVKLASGDLVFTGHTASFGSGEGDIFLSMLNFEGIPTDCNYSSPLPQTTDINLEVGTHTPPVHTITDYSPLNFTATNIELIETTICGCNLSLNLGNDTTICNYDTFMITPGPGFENYYWQDGSGDSVYMVSFSGTYWVEVLDEFGCIASDTIEIDFKPPIEVDLGNDTTLCDGDFVLLDAGFGYTDYLWQDGSSNASYYAGTTGWYWVEVTDENGCIAADSIQLEFVAPDPDIGSDTSFCEGDSVSFLAADFVTYLWQDGSTQPSFICDQSMLVWCQVTDTMGCVGSDSAFAQAVTAPDFSLGSDLGVCPGDKVVILSNISDPGISLVWQDGSEDSIFVTSEPGIYWLQATNLCGSVTDSIEVTQLPLPEVFLGNDTILSSNSAITLDAGGGFASYYWSDGTEQQWLTVQESGTFWVEVSDGKCINADTIVIEPINCELFVPIVFSPNSDQHNDNFYADVSDDIYDFNLTVFNRWGEKVWETSDKTGQWDGNRNGHPSASSVYYWVVTYQCIGSPQTFERRGSVTLLR